MSKKDLNNELVLCRLVFLIQDLAGSWPCVEVNYEGCTRAPSPSPPAPAPSPSTCAASGASCYENNNFLTCCTSGEICNPGSSTNATLTATCGPSSTSSSSSSLSSSPTTSTCAQSGASCLVNNNFITCCTAGQTCTPMMSGNTLAATCG